MSGQQTASALAHELSRVIAETPGVTRLYAPVRLVPVDGEPTVTTSIGVDVSATASATAIGAAVCTRVRNCLAAAGSDAAIKITIAYVAA